MGLFSKLFGKKQPAAATHQPEPKETASTQKGDIFIATGDHEMFKVVRPLTDEQKQRIRQSTLLLRTGQLYMHYLTDHLVNTDRKDPAWQNKVLFFWKAEEPFPKKSLPPEFETFEAKYFLFTGNTSGLTMQVGKAIPWFGMPGQGEKHVCQLEGQQVTIPELYEKGLVEYVEMVELTAGNEDALTDRENYLFLIDERITPFQNGHFYLGGKPVPIDVAYSIGGIHLIRVTGLE